MDIFDELQVAVENQSDSHVLQLLQLGEKKNHWSLKKDNIGTELLLRATQPPHACTKIIQHLLNHGAEANFKVLLAAISNSAFDETIIEKLLNHGASAKGTGAYNQNALHYAVGYKGKSKTCEVLIKYGANINQESLICRIPPLFTAIDKGHYDHVDVLLKCGAQPLREFDAPRGKGCPLQYIFECDRPVPVIENVVKYASLQINHSDDTSISEFLAHFKGHKSEFQRRSRMYFQFASKCLAEIENLKQHWVVDRESTLFDFVVSQGDTLQCFLSNPTTMDRIFKVLSVTNFLIYSEVILKKFERRMLVSKVSKFSWRSKSQVAKICLDTYSIEYICKFLPDKDVINLFITFITN